MYFMFELQPLWFSDDPQYTFTCRIQSLFYRKHWTKLPLCLLKMRLRWLQHGRTLHRVSGRCNKVRWTKQGKKRDDTADTSSYSFINFVRETEDIQSAVLPQRSSRVHRTVVTSVTLVLLITGLYVSVLEPQFICFRSFTYKSLKL